MRGTSRSSYSRKALTTAASDDVDMAMAAIKRVTYPAIASGTVRRTT